MAFPTIATPSNTFRVPAAINALYIRPASEKYQTLGAIRDGELMIEDYVQADSKKKNKAIGSKSVTAKVTMMQCSLTELELIDSLIAGTASFLFRLADAAAVPTGGAAATEGWVLLTSSQVGVKPKIVMTGDTDTPAVIQLEFAGSIQNSAVDAAIKASIDDDDFESSADAGAFHAVGIYTAAKDGGLPDVTHLKSCGIATLTLADTGGAAQTLGPIDNPTIEFEYMAEQDSQKIFRTRWVNININYQWKQTDAVNLLNLDAFTDAEIDAVLTLSSGIIITLSNQVGIQSRFESLADYDNTRSIVFSHTGSILTSAVDGIFSV